MPDIHLVMEATRQASLQAASGERRARFERLYGECHATVVAYVARRASSPEDAADAIADTFLVAWRRLDEIPAGAERRLWLYGVARRVLANQRRGRTRRIALDQRLASELEPLMARAAHSQPSSACGRLADVAAAFRRLSESDQDILAMQSWEELDAGQIAAVLGCSRNAARIRLHRSRRRLTQQIAGEQATASPEATARPGAAI